MVFNQDPERSEDMWPGCRPNKVGNVEYKHRGGPSLVLVVIPYSTDVTFWLLAVDPQHDPIIIEISRRTAMGDSRWSYVVLNSCLDAFLYSVLNQDPKDRREKEVLDILFHVRAFTAMQC